MKKSGFSKRLTAILSAIASTDVVDPNSSKHNRSVRRYKKRKERTPEEIAAFEESRKLKQGLKKFFYGENYVIALNQRNADRKARQQGFIK